jgi:fructosamine-3-kinase
MAASAAHPMLSDAVLAAVENAAAAHSGARWTRGAFSDRGDLASHPCGVFSGRPFSVFAKLGEDSGGERFAAELSGLRLLHDAAGIAVPAPVGTGVAGLPAGSLLLLEALPERRPEARSRADWRSIGHTLARLHQVRHATFGLDRPGFFGPLRQDNRPVGSNRWADFYAERRLIPCLRLAADSGHLPPGLAAGVEKLAARLPSLCGPEPVPSLLHGDAQQHNFVSTPGGAVVIDPAPYFGHPEIDLALLGYFDPVPGDVLEAYQDMLPVDGGFAGRRELWRLFGYLAVIAEAGGGSFRRRFLGRLASALRRYR